MPAKPFQVQVTISQQELARLESLGANILGAIQEAGRETTRETQGLVETIGAYPSNRAKHPIEWTSERQRRYWFAVLLPRLEKQGRIDSYGYKRSKQLKEAWSWQGDNLPNGYELTIANSAKYASFVYGDLAKTPAQSRRPQQKFHANTGWDLAYNQIMKAGGRWLTIYTRNLDKRLKLVNKGEISIKKV